MAIIRVTNVPTSALADDVITSAKISDGTIAVSDLADNAITTAKIADANVTSDKVATDAITTAKIADSAVTTAHMHSSVPLGTKNLLINGDMQVWQRGTTFNVTSTEYAADRWQTQGQIWTGTRSTDVPVGFEYSLDITSNSSGYGSFGQKIEARNCKHLVGKDVTLSFYSKAISGETNCYVLLKVPGAEDNWSSSSNVSNQVISDIGSTWTRHSFTFTNLPSSVANGLLVMLFHGIGSTTQRRYTGLQLEVGDTATTFEYRPYDMELARCQRYFYKGTFAGGAAADNDYSRNALGGSYPQRLRISPQITLNDGSLLGHHGLTPTALLYSGEDSLIVEWTGDGYRDIGSGARFNVSADAEL